MIGALVGPTLAKLTGTVTVPPTTEESGGMTVVNTSALLVPPTSVVALAESGARFGPWLVLVPTLATTFTLPLDGAV